MWIFLKLQNWRLYFFLLSYTYFRFSVFFVFGNACLRHLFYIHVLYLKRKNSEMKIYGICHHIMKLFRYIRTSIVPLYMFFLICWCACMFNWFLNRQSLCLFTWQTQKKKERKKELISLIKINNWTTSGLSFFKAR